MEIKGAIFDQDGLLFDTERVYAKAWVGVSDLHGYGFTEEMTRLICGHGRGEIGAKILEFVKIDDVEGYIDEVMAEARRLLLAAPPVLKPGVREILAWCRENAIKTAIASSSPRDCIDWNLASTNLRGMFDEVISGEEVAHGKPNPDIFLLAAKRLELAPQDCIVFEDAFGGIRAAVEAGCKAVMIPDRSPASDEIRKIAQVFPSLPDWLENFKKGAQNG